MLAPLTFLPAKAAFDAVRLLVWRVNAAMASDSSERGPGLLELVPKVGHSPLRSRNLA